jgi:glycosyltransferase 2 family protein
MARPRELIKRGLSALIIAAVAFFFYRAFQRNWAEIQAAQLRLEPVPLLGAGVLVLGGYLLSTYGWYISVNALSDGSRLTFKESVATFNASGLTKYLPGKVWSYALQMYWLGAVGFSKTLVVYVNIVNLMVSLLTSSLVGLLCLVCSSSRLPLPLTLGALALVTFGDLVIIKYYSRVFGAVVAFVNRRFKREIRYFPLSRRLMLELQVIHVLAAVVSGVSTYLVCLGVSYPLRLGDAPLVAAASLISDVAGFLAIVVPAGLGVREGLMFFLLGGVSLGSLPIVLPVASRLVTMLVDIGLGAVAIRLLRNLTGTSARADAVMRD